MLLSPNLLFILGGTWLAFFLINRFVRRPLKYIRGPTPTSFLAGYEYDLLQQENVGDNEFKWFREYGTAFRVSGVYAEEVLMVADPKALQYIFHTSGYRFIRPIDFRRRICRIFDKGILWADGETHRRHRKVLNPAFSAQQLRLFLALSQDSVSHLAGKWKEEMARDGSVEKTFDIPKWLGRMTLDIIGKSSFDFDFGALDSKSETPLRKLFLEIFSDSIKPSKRTIVHRSLERYIPFVFGMFPTKEAIRHKAFLDKLRLVARELYARNEWTGEGNSEETKGDILSVLARANHAEDVRKKLSEDEVLSQVATMISAGQNTIAFSTTYLLYELSRHLEDQARVSHEIHDLRAKIGPDAVPTSHDYDSLPFFNAVIKEALRLHPILPTNLREASEDDIIPLEFPITTASGEVIHQISVRKGQRIHSSFAAYNRLSCVWGSDADDWNPSRFLDDKRSSQMNVGVYSNLMTFGAGVRACIGWRFALMEIQSILFGLLESFQLTFPCVPSGSIDSGEKEGYELQRVPVNIMVPSVKGKARYGPTMPLNVKMLGRPNKVQL